MPLKNDWPRLVIPGIADEKHHHDRRADDSRGNREPGQESHHRGRMGRRLAIR
jgi:hypothetical protein